MPVTASTDAGGAKKKLEEFRKTIAAHTGARCVITPTQVIYYHCERKGAKLLDVMPASAHADVERKWAPKVEEATRQSVRRITGQANAAQYEAAIARAWRYGAYLMIDRLWAEVKRGAWGKIASSTEPGKVGDVQRQQGRQDVAREARGLTVRVRSAQAAVGWVVNYGVRAIESGRQWYNVQKGKTKHGQRTDHNLVQDPPVIEVKVGSRTISSV